MKAVVSAYYHASEAIFAFGPFSERALEKFLNNDPAPEKHTDWFVTWYNDPKLYGTGNERSSN